MSRQGRTQLVLGVLLILLGAWFVAGKAMPDFGAWAQKFMQWPYTLISIGALIMVIGLAIGAPGMAVPACIVAGIGGIFYYNEFYASQSAWAYMWTLILGFVGLGSVLAGLLGETPRQSIPRGLNLMVVSAVLFLVFSAIFGGWGMLGNYVPAILLIALGVWVLASSLWKMYRKE